MELPAIPETDAKADVIPNGHSVHPDGETLVSVREREALGRVCWLLHEAGTLALRTTFDSIHPPLYLPDHLQHMHVKTLLQRLRQQDIISDIQWRQLYPPRKRKKKFTVTSQKFDTKVLVVLLQTCCHLSPPYPHGWHVAPLPTDSSLSSDIVRLQLQLQQVGALGGLRKEEYPVVWQQAVHILTNLGNQEVKVKIQRIEKEALPSDQASKYIALIKQAWAPAESQAMVAKLREIEKQRRRASGGKSGYKRKDGVQEEGIPAEDKVVITQTYKLLTENVQAEDVLDRLQQGQVVKVNDRQEILALSKNSDRMHVLLPKIIKSPIPYAFKLLCDALKFKNPKVYEQLMRTRKAVYKQGVSVTMDVGGITKEGLETRYKEVFSEFCPLPWSEETCTVKDIFSQVELVYNDGKTAPLGATFPAQTDRSRGPRVLIEGSPGSGKTTLASMLTYMWATAPHTFENRYKYLFYLDAHAMSGTLADEIYSQLLPPSIKVSQSEVWALVEENPRDVLLLVDGFEGSQGGTQLTKVIQGSNLRACAVVALVRPEARVDGFVRPDLKLHLLGIKPTSIASCLRGYARLLAAPHLDTDSGRLVTGGGADSGDGANSAELHRQTPGSPRLNSEIDLPENYPLRGKMTSPFILTSTIAVSQILGCAALEAVDTLTSLCEQLLLALATAYVQRQPLPEATPTDPDEAESKPEGFPEEVTMAVGRLETLAFHTLTSRQLAFTEAELDELIEGDQTLMQLGALQKSGPGQRYKFSCSFLRDFLAARFLADLDPVTLKENIETFALLRSPRTAYMVAFACGLYQKDRSSPTLTALFQQMALQNERRLKRAVGFRHGSAGAENKRDRDRHAATGRDNSKTRTVTTSNKTISNKITDNGYSLNSNGHTLLNGHKEQDPIYTKSSVHGLRTTESYVNSQPCDLASNVNSLYVFSHSLLALAECQGRADLITALSPSFPRRLQVGRENGLLVGGLVTGLSHLLKSDNAGEESVSGLGVISAEINLMSLHERQRETWLELAQALGRTESLRSLTVNWKSAEMMAEFLFCCLSESPRNLSTIHVVDHTSGGSKVDHEASTWANIRGFCSKLEPHVREFSFLGSRAASVTCHVVQSVPPTLKVLDLSGSAFNMMAAAQLGEALETATETGTLKLSCVQLPGPAMAALVQGLKRCSCLQFLGLAGVTLDRNAVDSLVEFIKLTSSLRVLDLSRTRLTSEMCTWLASCVSQARSLRRVLLHETVLPDDGRLVLESAAGESVVLEGLDIWSDIVSVRTI